MSDVPPEVQALLKHQSYPLASKYDASWILANNMGPHPLQLCEALCSQMQLEPGMRVLDLGCGKALTSIFLAKEFGVSVTAADLWISPSENWQRIKEAGVEELVTPLSVEAHRMPFADGFFDAVVAVDSFNYFGTDATYLDWHLLPKLRPGGQIGVIVPGLSRELGGEIPEHLLESFEGCPPFWEPRECAAFRSAAWWLDHWSRCEGIDVERCEALPDGAALWQRWQHALSLAEPDGGHRGDLIALRKDAGATIGFVCAVGRKR